MTISAVQTPVAAAASPTDWITEYETLVSSDLSHRVHALWAAAYASPEFAALRAERAARPRPPRVTPPSVTAIEPPAPLTPAEYANRLRETAANGIAARPVGAVAEAALGRLNRVVTSSDYQLFVSKMSRLLDDPAAADSMTSETRLASAAAPEVCPPDQDNVECYGMYAAGELTYLAGAAVLAGCAAGPAGCGAGTVIAGGLTAAAGLVVVFVQAWRASRPNGRCTDTAHMGQYTDWLGYRYVVLYNRVDCTVRQDEINVYSVLLRSGSGVVGTDYYVRYSSTLAEPSLLYGPYPPAGTYGGGNSANAYWGPNRTRQSMNANAPSYYYAG